MRSPLDDLASLATGREEPFLMADFEARRAEIQSKVGGKRVLAIGAAGTIGSSTVKALAPFGPSALHVVDQSENNLAELVRDLRATPGALGEGEFRTLPLDYGSQVFARYLNEQPPFDLVLNFAALKHVRSEKDPYSLLQMIDTNIVKQARVLGWLRRQSNVRYFSVSTDKAANPVNLMGATKRFMEHVMFGTGFRGEGRSVSSARFANVAFSDGSLLYTWTVRLAKRQPLPVPEATKRFFVSIRESGLICLLASVSAGDGQIAIPALDPSKDLVELQPIAEAFLRKQGLEPALYRDEAAAVAAMASDLERGRYPVLVTPLDTSGEKPFEEFVGDGETVESLGMRHLEAVRYDPAPPGTVERFLSVAERAVLDPEVPFDKETAVAGLKDAIPLFAHIETGRNLDERL